MLYISLSAYIIRRCCEILITVYLCALKWETIREILFAYFNSPGNVTENICESDVTQFRIIN